MCQCGLASHIDAYCWGEKGGLVSVVGYIVEYISICGERLATKGLTKSGISGQAKT